MKLQSFWREGGVHKPRVQRWLVMLPETLDGIMGSALQFICFPAWKKKRKGKKKEGRKEKVPGLIHWAGTGENLRGSVCILQCAFICAFYMCPLGTAFWTISVSPSLLFLLYFSFYFHSLWGCLSSHISFFPRLKRAVWIGLAYFHSFLAWAGISSIYVSWYGLCAVSQGKIHLSDSCSFH